MTLFWRRQEQFGEKCVLHAGEVGEVERQSWDLVSEQVKSQWFLKARASEASEARTEHLIKLDKSVFCIFFAVIKT